MTRPYDEMRFNARFAYVQLYEAHTRGDGMWPCQAFQGAGIITALTRRHAERVSVNGRQVGYRLTARGVTYWQRYLRYRQSCITTANPQTHTRVRAERLPPRAWDVLQALSDGQAHPCPRLFEHMSFSYRGQLCDAMLDFGYVETVDMRRTKWLIITDAGRDALADRPAAPVSRKTRPTTPIQPSR